MDYLPNKHRIYLVFVCIILLVFVSPVAVRAEENLPAKAYIQGVKGHPQKYALSCESRSAVDWAAYWGTEISEKKFLTNLPRSDNPDKGFVGQPGDSLGNLPPESYGVHAGPVAELLREFGIPAEAKIEIPWETVQMELAVGRPVIVWVIGQMWKGRPVRYTASDGETSTVARYEHTMILVGYTPSFVIAIDPANGAEASYPLSAFLTSWDVLGRMAIIGGNEWESAANEDDVVVAPSPIPASVPPGSSAAATAEDAPRIYTVRRGEYLTGIAKKLSINWRKLARLNHLDAPYILYTGQKIQLP